MVSVTTLPFSRPLTRADLEMMPDDGHRYELIDGALIVTPAPATRHQQRATDLRPQLTETGQPCSWGRAGDLGQPQSGVGFLQRVDHRVQVPIQNLIKVVGLEADPVIRNPVLRKVVGTDAL